VLTAQPTTPRNVATRTTAPPYHDQARSWAGREPLRPGRCPVPWPAPSVLNSSSSELPERGTRYLLADLATGLVPTGPACFTFHHIASSRAADNDVRPAGRSASLDAPTVATRTRPLDPVASPSALPPAPPVATGDAMVDD
jgi:hypothetical protein